MMDKCTEISSSLSTKAAKMDKITKTPENLSNITVFLRPDSLGIIPEKFSVKTD